ncbi:hypothetical protein [Streptobacillus moniliformis]|uniref:Uncharacterized protein n=1 Tax=Streptobacillus moniliformis (strain ATCC 14647 / DSM 12112 / NCTC 10651 / 9901) TaxID=519441 RepID=D1AW17_STRM9|nr:hypothetical protein [Streptobacillus moniliformis]ACZ01927.1 hypothetical protein Smon_1496 [Streptobacillus moniliformis DSM 12112]SQA12864.1 Uncharacterised protein [Streptobacillus moniliformis]
MKFFLIDIVFWIILTRIYFYFGNYKNKFIREIIFILSILIFYILKFHFLNEI